MSSKSQRPVGRRSAIMIFYFLAVGSGILRTFSVTFDVVAMNTILIGYPLEYGLMSQWVSFAVVLFTVAILSIPRTTKGSKRSLGYSLDPDFGKIGVLPKIPMLYMVLAGVFAGISTLFYYIIVGASDASTVLPYGQLVIIYLLLGDLFAEKDTPTIIEIQCVISILLGVLLVGVVDGGFNIVTLIIVLVPMNISSALMTYFQRKTKRYEIRPGLKVDSLNMRLWSLLFVNITFSLIAVPIIPPSSWTVMSSTFIPLLWLMIGSAITIFLSLVLYVRALGRGSMAIVNSLSSVSVVLGLVVTLFGNFLLPGGFGMVTTDPFIWELKIFGIILVMIGVIALEAADVRSMVIIKVKPQTGDILSSLFDIKGVEKVAALAGSYDYVLSIKSRSLGKTRKNILKRVQAIPEVDSIETLVVLRDYR